MEAHKDEHFFLLAGDTAYPISEWLVKPFSTADAVADPNQKGLFNKRLSGEGSLLISIFLICDNFFLLGHCISKSSISRIIIRKINISIATPGLRTAMSEDVFGVLKSRFPCLKSLRCHLPLAQGRADIWEPTI